MTLQAQHLHLDLLDQVALTVHLDLAVQCYLMVQDSQGFQESLSPLLDQLLLEYLLALWHQYPLWLQLGQSVLRLHSVLVVQQVHLGQEDQADQPDQHCLMILVYQLVLLVLTVL